MRGLLGKLWVAIGLDTKEFNQGVDGAEKKTKQFSIKSIAAFGAMALGAVAAFRKITRAVSESVQLYGRQVDAEQGLRAAINATGQEVSRVFPIYNDLANEIQDLTTVGDEAALEMITLATSMGIAEDQMEETIKGAIGLADAFGIGTQQALRGVTNALEGNFQTLQRYIPALRSAETEADKLAIVQDAMAGGFEVSQARAETAFGALQQYGNAVGDLQEQLGQTVAEGIEPFVRVLTGFVQRVVESTKETREFADIIDRLREGETIEDFGADQLRSALTKAREELEAFEAGQRRLTGAAREASEVRLKQLQEQEAAIARALENERIRARILAEHGDVSDEYKAFLEDQNEAIERQREVLLELEKIRFEGLTPQEQELELVQQRLNDLVKERDAIEGTTQAHKDQYNAIEQLIITLSRRRAELNEEIEGEVEEVESLGDAYEDTASDIQRAMLQQRLWNDELENGTEGLTEYQEKLMQFGDIFTDAVGPVLEGFGEALSDAEDGWISLGQTAVRAVAQMIRAYARLWAAKSVAYFVDGNIPQGMGMAAAATGGFIAAGIVEGLASQIQKAALGADFVTSGPQLLMVGDNPGGRERVSVEPLSSPNVNGPSEDLHVQINLDGETISKFITRGTRSGRILVDQRGIV